MDVPYCFRFRKVFRLCPQDFLKAANVNDVYNDYVSGH